MIVLLGYSFEKGHTTPFCSQIRQVSSFGTIDENKTIDFEFANADKPHESYVGENVVLRYNYALYIVLASFPNSDCGTKNLFNRPSMCCIF
jgi:hypothetical protein